MQDLLEEFDPLSINKHTQIGIITTKNHPSSALKSNYAHQAQTNIRRPSASSNSNPLFSSAATTTAAPSDQSNPSIIGKIKPQADHLSSTDLDPLGFLADSQSTAASPNTQKSLLIDAQIRSKFRQDALAKHLAHEPFRPQSPSLQPPPLSTQPNSTSNPYQKPLITLSKLDQEPMTCFIDPTTALSPNDAAALSSPPADHSVTKNSPSNNANTNSIKIPSQIFQNQANKSRTSKNESPSPKSTTTKPLSLSGHPESSTNNARAEPRMTKAVDQHKLAAALLEDFDEFVSASGPGSAPSSSKKEAPIDQHTPREFQTFKTRASPSPAIKAHNSGHSTPLSFFEGHEGRPSPIQFVGADSQSQLVMDDELAEGIRLHLPSRLKIPSTWRLMYSIDQHGTSLGTLYEKVRSISSMSGTTAGCILALKDQDGNRFGAFVNEAFKPSKEYYGTGECFLWKAVMFEPGDFRIGVTVKVYLWTGANDYMILSDHDLLSIGGGDGKFGLWIDSNLDKGASSSCPAFNNEVLCSITNKHPTDRTQDDGTFEVIALECWTVCVS
ncbi:hypothetical protein PtA15_2A687 [Puccinia triticina]|uniref:Oxidation resistance protein 1 n=1 Tax=Puccinia triticina TaxID=208348 RepID=A0ABY7CEV6_9BASI|nr:uncharacterized protein PtA15_2A687 [Puccinia triticina]WAQ82370.1 hypothetical protein PtA15_2A687 [Puccinia triticina]WAR53225.1 hypothetical protein PtB15_2B656 [Puccinia triticina]